MCKIENLNDFKPDKTFHTLTCEVRQIQHRNLSRGRFVTIKLVWQQTLSYCSQVTHIYTIQATSVQTATRLVPSTTRLRSVQYDQMTRLFDPLKQ